MFFSLFTGLSILHVSHAWTWHTSGFGQCETLTIRISGQDSRPPFTALIVPYGETPLPNNVEVRKIIEVPFTFNGNEYYQISFPLGYPAGSRFIDVVRGGNGIGYARGGNYISRMVTNSYDSSCFDPTKNAPPPLFTFLIYPKQISQCQETRIYWNPSEVQGTPNFIAAVPDGEVVDIPVGYISDIPGYGRGFIWKTWHSAGTSVIIVGGDERGNGTGGSTATVIQSGTNANSSGYCPYDASATSTLRYPSPDSGSGRPSDAKLVGGILGGFFAIVILIFAGIYVLRRFTTARRLPVHMAEVPETVTSDRQSSTSRTLSPYSDHPVPMTNPHAPMQPVYISPTYVGPMHLGMGRDTSLESSRGMSRKPSPALTPEIPRIVPGGITKPGGLGPTHMKSYQDPPEYQENPDP